MPRDFKKDGDYAKNNFTYLWAAKHEVEEAEAQKTSTKPRADNDGLSDWLCGTSNSHNSLKAVLILGINS